MVGKVFCVARNVSDYISCGWPLKTHPTHPHYKVDNIKHLIVLTQHTTVI